MCEKCLAAGVHHSQDTVEADEKVVKDFTDHYRNELKDNSTDVVIPALLQLLRERLEERSRAAHGDESIHWHGGTVRVILEGLMGCTFMLEQLVKTSDGLVPLHQIVAEANFMEPTVGKHLN